MQSPRYISIPTIGMPYEKRRRIDQKRDKLSEKNILEVKIDGRPFEIKIHDYRLLEKGVMMNDKLIEFYLSHMHSKLSDEDKDKSYVFSTYFYTSLTKPVYLPTIDPSLSRSKNRHNKVKRWTRNINIFQKDFIFVPIQKCDHWVLAVICFPYLSGKVHIENGTPSNEPDDDTGRYKVSLQPIYCGIDEADPNVEDLWLFDLCSQASMKNHQDRYDKYYDDVEVLKTQKKNKLVKRPCILIFDSYSRNPMINAMVSATLREWLQHEYSNKYNGQQKDFQFMKACTVKVPQQPNQTDCGLFVMHYFEMFYSRPIIDYTFPIHHLENWFHTDDVVKNEKKRKEVYNIIMEKRKAQALPDDFELPVLHLNDHIEESVDIHNLNDLFEKNDKKEEKEEEKKEEDKEETVDKREGDKEEKEDVPKKKTLRRSRRKIGEEKEEKDDFPKKKTLRRSRRKLEKDKEEKEDVPKKKTLRKSRRKIEEDKEEKEDVPKKKTLRRRRRKIEEDKEEKEDVPKKKTLRRKIEEDKEEKDDFPKKKTLRRSRRKIEEDKEEKEDVPKKKTLKRSRRKIEEDKEEKEDVPKKKTLRRSRRKRRLQ